MFVSASSHGQPVDLNAWTFPKLADRSRSGEAEAAAAAAAARRAIVHPDGPGRRAGSRGGRDEPADDRRVRHLVRVVRADAVLADVRRRRVHRDARVPPAGVITTSAFSDPTFFDRAPYSLAGAHISTKLNHHSPRPVCIMMRRGFLPMWPLFVGVSIENSKFAISCSTSEKKRGTSL